MSEPKNAPGPEGLAPTPPKQSGSDRFDEAALTTPARSIVALCTCLVLVAGVVVWAVTARVDETTTGSAVSLVDGSLDRVVTRIDGIVTAVQVKPGEQVTKGQPLAQISAPDDSSETLHSIRDGRVLNAPYVPGTAVTAGDSIMVIEPTEGIRVLRMFLDPLEAEQVQTGTKAVISFPGRAEIPGQVSAVSLLPLAREQVETLLGSPALARLVLTAEAAVAVTVTPDAGQELPQPGDGSEGGRVARVSLILGIVHPIEYVI